MAETDPHAWLHAHQHKVTPPDEVLAWYDGLPAATLEEAPGRWQGSGLRTGHPLDGLLEAYGWYGKEFLDAERVHPLLFRNGAPADVVPVDPARLPVRLADRLPSLAREAFTRRAFRSMLPVLRTSRYAARLRLLQHRDVLTLAMIYDDLPIIDVFRRIGADTLVGLMDRRDDPHPFFFTLRRVVSEARPGPGSGGSD